MSDTDKTPAIVFRTVKKRKYRQKPSADDDAIHLEPSLDPTVIIKKEETDDTQQQQQQQRANSKSSGNESALSEALRMRNAHKNRLKGVAFRADTSTKGALGVKMEGIEETKAGMEEAEGGIIPIHKRFAPQTGIIGELVNKHMDEYIESELAKRHSTNPYPPSTNPTTDNGSSSAAAGTASSSTNTRRDASGNLLPQPPVVLRPSMRGKVMEVDLGEEARNQNVALTELATRKLAGGAESGEDEDGQASKVRMGKDGKPYRVRNRRGSDAINRDRMVEELMSENKLDIYDNPSLTPLIPPVADEGAADDRIAEEFRREFMDAMSQRRRRRAAASRTTTGAKGAAAAAKQQKDEPILRGPKLGGSRNARAAMRDKLLEQQIAQQKQHPELQRPKRRR